jgi:hypothetical protein
MLLRYMLQPLDIDQIHLMRLLLQHIEHKHVGNLYLFYKNQF